MKRRIMAVLLLVLFAFTLSACKGEVEKGANENFGKGEKDIYIFRDLSVQDVMIADFDTSKYDKDEYLGYLQEEIDTYFGHALSVLEAANTAN